jgi:5-methyltetrahydropteroyltriglutamate--homocysteine methyltransferase
MVEHSIQYLRTDQVGSLLRPEWLKDVYRRRGEGLADDDEVRAAQDTAVRQVVANQESAGVRVITDGELVRLNFQDSFTSSVAGLAQWTDNTIQAYERRVMGARPLERWEVAGFDDQGRPVNPRHPALDRLRLVRNRPLEEYVFASSITSRPVKVTMVGVDRLAERFDAARSQHVYPSVDDFVSDVVEIQRTMIRQLRDAGCRYIQIDEPSYTAYVDRPSLDQMRARGEDPAVNLERSIRADNAVIDGFDDVTFGIHLCRGNQRSMWHRQGSYDEIAEQLFAGLRHHRLLLEYDTERAGGFEPLRFVPKDKVVVLGLVSTKDPMLESPDDLKRRIDWASRFVPLEQLALSPQCGFASTVVGNVLDEDDQWRKLRLIERVAREVWT